MARRYVDAAAISLDAAPENVRDEDAMIFVFLKGYATFWKVGKVVARGFDADG